MKIRARIRRHTQLVVAALACCVAGAGAQVRVLPHSTLPGVTENYVLQVSNTHQQQITRVELRFPRSVRVASLAEKSGWYVQTATAGSRISAAIWTGTLPPGQYADFGFIGVNPVRRVALFWPVIVTYADGERGIWWPNSVGTKAPTTVVAPLAHSSTTIALAFAICLLALVLALSGLVLALRGGAAPSVGFHSGSE